ncbi:Sporulation thiol-disulfide oxidoreductase A [Pseudoalteromonas holothuriae]|uniref:Sporulation thiol-disulfide oxidoreductase A n=1 Tax=Pseudoalteromonas holothuriae TaxID=2963714 RepID=A0ABM9GKQ3_9GAMM|nr:TlpA disulfide reductase family protein [Pseudoalteromonas sp. CIP111951]CAH9063218.1 Sporulation thiol-disulfide oxidoreductase A [Pseudoalteromonas sp. CIP111951]
MKLHYPLIALLIGLYNLSCQAEPLQIQTTTLQGEKISTLGKVTYLKFWATWCRYCIEEMPHLEQAFKTRSAKLNVVSVNIGLNQSPELVKRFLDKHDYHTATAFDHDGSLSKKFNVIGTPTHILLDEQGQEIYRTALINDELNSALSAYLPKENNHD